VADEPVARTTPITAAIFDLFGTLVPEFPRSEFEDHVRAMARALDRDEEAFLEAWRDTAVLRQTGAYPGGMPENVAAICAAVGGTPPSADEIASALAPRADLYRRWFVPRPGAVETLTAIRERGLPIALISMCAPDTPPLWRASVLAPLVDVTVFSSETGLRKPERAIYRAATAALGVPPEDCLYCGDGAYAELTGAAALGMTAVEIRDPDVVTSEQLRPEGEDWDGPWVPDLRDLLVYLGNA
jgi:putative hydrolase of the HAD superfamily